MALTESIMPGLGMQAPGFCLPDTEGRLVSLSCFEEAPALLVMFICNHCPYVVHIREGLARFSREMMIRGVAVVGINSNDASSYPDDSPERMVEEKITAGYPFPYLYDESQDIARAYQAACTPDFFLFNQQRELVYRGQFDDSRPGNGRPVTGKDLLHAVEDVLAGKTPDPYQHPSAGCNIKWR